MVVLRFFRSSGKRIKPDGTILVDASELANYVQIAAVTPSSLIGSLNSLPNAQRRLLAT
jgi:hypothetical protein